MTPASSRPSKRARVGTDNGVQTNKPRQGGLFAPFRSLGHVSTKVPFAILSKSSKHLETPAITVVTSMGNNWALWEGATLRLMFVGPDMGAPITSLAMSMDSVYASSNNWIGRYVRGKQVDKFVINSSRQSHEDSDDSDSDAESSSASSSSASSSSGSSSSSGTSSTHSKDDDDDFVSAPEAETIGNLTLFGTTLVALSSSGKRMYVWDVPAYIKPASKDPALQENSSATVQTKSLTPYAVLDMPTNFTATKIVHPASYLNKVVVASREGELAVWNVRTATLIHTFTSDVVSPTAEPSPITALVQSPAIDVLGVGFSNGICALFDVRMGEVLGKVRLEGEGCGEVAGVGFRNDDIGQTLAVTSSTGHIALFDLAANMRLLHLVRAAHEGPVGGLEWLAGQPLMMTSGADNSLKQWLFDSPTAAPRLLKQRSGHHAPPHLVRYYGDDGKAILTAGADHAVRYTSVVRDSRGYELSQGSIAKKANHLGVKPSSLKLPLITSISFSTARSKDWDDVVTASHGESLGRTWSVERKRVGKHIMQAGGPVKSTAMSACGNFGFVGTASGEVVMYNMQSGMQRKMFKVPHGGVGDVRGKHVTGIAIDALNRVVVASTLKGGLHFFDFQTMKLRSSLSVDASITSILLQRDNNLLAAICDDLTIKIIDVETRRIVRELAGARGQILDVAFSPDSRWIMTTSQDSVIRTFDVPTGQLVDAFRTPSTATSLAFSPTGDFLATSHVDSVGVYLWANRAQFAEVSLRSFVEEDMEDVALPTVQGLAADEPLSELTAPVRWEDLQPYTTPDQLSEDLLTLSLMPRSRWQTLLNLETIKQRNKPKEAPKAPERAPFFLPTLPGVEQRFDLAATGAGANGLNGDSDAGRKQHKLDVASMSVETEFVRRLMQENESGDYQSFFEYLKALSPSATDLELRSLITLPHLARFLHCLARRLNSHRDFEAVQTLLAVFLRIHGDVLVANVELREGMMAVRDGQRIEAERLQNLTHYALGTLAFLRSTPIA